MSFNKRIDYLRLSVWPRWIYHWSGKKRASDSRWLSVGHIVQFN